MEYTILEIVKELNRIADIHKHPLTSTDERIANVSFDYNDVDTKFNESERRQIVDTFIAIAKHYKATEFGRIKIADVFHKCYINEEGQVVWNIVKKGRHTMHIVFATELTPPISGVPEWFDKGTYIDSRLVSTPSEGANLFRASNGEMLILKEDMDAFIDVAKIFCHVDYRHNELDYNALARVMPVNARLAITKPVGHIIPTVEFYFRGFRSSKPLVTLKMYNPFSPFALPTDRTRDENQQVDNLRLYIMQYDSVIR